MAKSTFIYIKNTTIHLEKEVISNGALLIKNKHIEAVYRQDQIPDHLPEGAQIIEGKHLSVIPGFIDGHIHGAAGADVMDATEGALDTMATVLPEEGTTSYLATTITQAPENLDKALINVANYNNKPGQAEMIGVHLEGPFIERNKAGAQPLAYIIEPDMEQFKKWQEMSGNQIKTITLAPEHDKDGNFIQFLHASGINVSAGHTDADFSEMEKAVSRGVRQVTHICNAMTGKIGRASCRERVERS